MSVALCINTVVQIGGGWCSPELTTPDINPWHLSVAVVTRVCKKTFILSSKTSESNPCIIRSLSPTPRGKGDWSPEHSAKEDGVARPGPGTPTSAPYFPCTSPSLTNSRARLERARSSPPPLPRHEPTRLSRVVSPDFCPAPCP